MKRAEANDAGAICQLSSYYYFGLRGLQQDHAKAMELYIRAAELGCSKAHNNLAGVYYEGGNMKKAKFHLEAAAMAGFEDARSNLGTIEYNSGKIERAFKHWTIAASAGCYHAMHALNTFGFKKGVVCRESFDSTVIAYNNSCAEMRSESRDKYISEMI
jgi:tetratricopeptide (TPR) repeat protein